MSKWHREHPELAGTWADPWMQHESYRKALGVRVPDSESQRPDVDEGVEVEEAA